MTLSVDVDRQIDSESLPWVPQAEGVWFRPLRLSPALGLWANLLKVAPGGTINRHRHFGAVEAWVIQGSWRYLEHDWVAGPGSYVHEPEGDVHTLVVDPAQEMVTLFIVHGKIEYLDDADNVIRVDTARSKLERYEVHCREHGLALADVVY